MIKNLLHPLLILCFAGIIFLSGIVVLVFPLNKTRAICPKCNIIVIDIDTLRADGLSCLGSSRNTSPNICGFFQEGVTFEKNYAQGMWTLPSIFSTLTSLYPFNHGVNEPFKDILPLKIPTLAETLKKSGYTTAWVGDVNWWVFSISNKNWGARGFDSVITPSPDSVDWDRIAKQQLSNSSPAFIYFYYSGLHSPYILSEDEVPIENLEKPKGFPVTQEEYDDSFADYLKQNTDIVFTELARREHPEIFNNVKNIDKDKLLDYFLSLNPDRNTSATQYVPNYFLHEYQSYFTRHIYSEDAEDQNRRVQYVRMLYDSKIFFADYWLSQLLKVLEETDISRKTIVILLSDHGEEFMEHGSFAHINNLYNELLHTPLFIKIPGIPSGKISEITQNIDVYPTILDAIGISNTFPIQGNSLLPLVTGANKFGYGYAISSQNYLQHVSIQNKEWKLIADFSVNPEADELHNLATDPAEQHNLIDIEKQKADELLKILIERVEKSKIDLSKI